MTTALRFALLCLALVLLLALGTWYYLFGPNRVNAAELVPGDTVVFATIPNAAELVGGYQTSRLKQLVDSPDSKPLLAPLANWIGPKNLALLQSFLPSLSGQSFIAITHLEPGNLAKIGLIAGLKPKPGAGNFNAFVAQVQAAYPAFLAQGKTGTGQVEGLDYQWIQGPGASDKICVAQYRGWIVTTWGEASLRDWWERLQKKAATPSLAENADYQKSLERVGKNSEAVLYFDLHALLGQAQAGVKGGPHASALGYLAKKWEGMRAAAVGSGFEQGDMADHFSILIPRQAQIDAGLAAEPCAFETLKFTGPATRFYWGSSFNSAQAWKNLEEQANTTTPVNPMTAAWMTSLQDWARNNHLDVQKNIIGALGNEVSLQSEWDADTSYPEVGLLVKLANPDDFKPTVAALIETIRQKYEATAVVNEITSNGQNFATLKFVQALPISPTVTENGPYFGLFLTETQAVRSFARDATMGLLNNPDFNRQIGDRRSGADQILFIDSPHLLDRAYQTAKPFFLMAQLLSPQVGKMLHGQTLPANLNWLAPIDSWSYVASSDDDGYKGYSISGVGNQGIFLAAALGGTAGAMQLLHHPSGLSSPSGFPSVGAPVPTAPAMPVAPAPEPASAPAPAAPAAAAAISPEAASPASVPSSPAAGVPLTNVPPENTAPNGQ